MQTQSTRIKKFEQKKTGELYETIANIRIKGEGYDNLKQEHIIWLNEEVILINELCFFFKKGKSGTYFRYFDLTKNKISQEKFMEDALTKLKKVMVKWKKSQ